MGNDTCPVESCTKIRFQHIHMRKLDRNRKNSTIWYVQPIKPLCALAQVKGIWGPHEAERTFFDLGLAPTHNLQVGSVVAVLIML